MSELDEVMMKHMKSLVYVERRPFTFKDFQHFLCRWNRHTV